MRMRFPSICGRMRLGHSVYGSGAVDSAPTPSRSRFGNGRVGVDSIVIEADGTGAFGFIHCVAVRVADFVSCEDCAGYALRDIKSSGAVIQDFVIAKRIAIAAVLQLGGAS